MSTKKQTIEKLKPKGKKSKEALKTKRLLKIASAGEERHKQKPRVEYSGPAYDLYISIDWATAHDQFYERDTDGKYKYASAFSFCKHLAKGSDRKESEKRSTLLMRIIGPSRNSDTSIVPYLGDWEYERAGRFIGQLDKENLLFGNPKIQAVRDAIKRHRDLLDIAKTIGSNILVQWLGRWEVLADKCDAYWLPQLFVEGQSRKTSTKNFEAYQKQQQYLFSRTIESCTEILRCFGVSKDNISLLAQMMVNHMQANNAVSDRVASVMFASSVDGRGTPLDGKLLGGNVEEESDWKKNPLLKTAMETFVQKSIEYDMEMPGLDIPGVNPEDTRTDPRKDKKLIVKDSKVVDISEEKKHIPIKPN